MIVDEFAGHLGIRDARAGLVLRVSDQRLQLRINRNHFLIK